jgi:sensor histidine kinase YesM
MNRSKKIKLIAALDLLGLLDEPVTRNYWVHPLNHGKVILFDHFYMEIRNYPDKFFDYFRMSVQSFDELLHFIHDAIIKKDTVFLQAISTEKRLAITLR